MPEAEKRLRAYKSGDHTTLGLGRQHDSGPESIAFYSYVDIGICTRVS